MLLMLCGYRGAGKDFTFELLKKNERLENHWHIYCNRFHLSNDEVVSYFNASLPVKRVSFADSLKDVTCERYGITRKWLEENKDSPVDTEFKLQHQLPSNIDSYRHLLCHVGAEGRSRNPDCWTIEAFKRIENGTLNVITDFRLPSELKYTKLKGMKVLTARIIRYENTIPPEDLPLEHELDDYSTDLIFCDVPLERMWHHHHKFEWTNTIPHYLKMEGI